MSLEERAKQFFDENNEMIFTILHDEKKQNGPGALFVKLGNENQIQLYYLKKEEFKEEKLKEEHLEKLLNSDSDYLVVDDLNTTEQLIIKLV